MEFGDVAHPVGSVVPELSLAIPVPAPLAHKSDGIRSFAELLRDGVTRGGLARLLPSDRLDPATEPVHRASVVQFAAGQRFESADYRAELRAILADPEHDLYVMVHDASSATLPGAGTTAVSIVRRSIAALVRHRGDFRFVKQTVLRYLTWRLIQRNAKALFVCYDHERQHVKRKARRRVIVIDHPTPDPGELPDRLTARRQLDLDNCRVVTLLGFLSVRKGVPDAVAALAELDRDVVLVLAGAPTDERFAAELRAAAAQFGGRVRVTGWLENEQQATVIAATDLAIAPFRSAAASGSILRWAADGVPLLSSPTPLARELERRTGGLVSIYHDQQGLAAAIRANLPTDAPTRRTPWRVDPVESADRILAEVSLRSRRLIRLFVVGCPRSGTTLLQSMLAANPGLVGFPETHAFRNRSLANDRAALQTFKDTLSERVLRCIEPELERVDNRFIPIPCFLHAAELAVLEQGRIGWVEKTPDHLLHVRAIERDVPGARFVHIIRDPVDVVSSLHRLSIEHPTPWSEAFSDINRAISRWLQSAQAHLVHIGQPGHLMVSYEQLVDNPEQVLRQLCGWLEIDFASSMIHDFGLQGRRLRGENEPWKERNSGPLLNPRASTLSAAEQDEVRRRCEGDWARLQDAIDRCRDFGVRGNTTASHLAASPRTPIIDASSPGNCVRDLGC